MKRKFTLFTILLFISYAAFSQVTLKMGSVENAEPGTYIQVPVIVSGLSVSGQSFIGMQFTFTFQGNVLTYDAIAEGNPLLPLGEWIAGSIPGQAAANWFEPGFEPTNVDDNSTILLFVLFYSGGQTDLAFDESVTEIYANTQGDLIPISTFISGTVTQAQGSESSIWNGTGSWSTAANWSNGIPGDSTNAVISTGETEIETGAVCRNFNINAGAKLIIQPGKSLTVNGNYNNDGEILINSDTLIQGSLIVKGTIHENGVSIMAMNIYNDVKYTISSPVVGETAEVLAGVGTAYFYSESTNVLENLAPSSILDPGHGYAFESSSDATVNFDGLFNTNEINTNLGFTDQGNILSQGWNLVGNPYTCSIDADDFITTENADKAIYVWNNNRFLVWNGIAGTIPFGIIPPLTGFFVKANASIAKITFNKNAKLHDFSHFSSSYAAPSNVLQLNMLDFDNNIFLDEAFIQVETSATFGYDGTFDALKLDYLWDYPQLFVNDSENNRLAIAAIPEATEVTMGIKVLANGAYTIKSASANFLPEKHVYLIDQELEITKNLKEEDYTFLADAGIYPGRFKLVMTELGTDDLDENAGMIVYSKQSRIYINPLRYFGKSVIKIYDLSGRIVARSQETLEPGSSVSIQGIRGINIVSVVTTSAVIRYKLLIR